MPKRELDKSKKSNIKCEHCFYGDKPTKPCENYYCAIHQKEVNYWNRCKDFKWSERYE